MPKNNVTDPITDQEMAFAHLVLSGTMNDRRAAEAVGLNPGTAAYTKGKPRVRAYMSEHRAAVQEKLAEKQAEELHTLNISRDQILARLWQLATLNPESTRGSMAGQIKALAMIVAIEGLIPDRRLAPPPAAPVPSPIPRANIYTPEWLRERQRQAAEETPPVDPLPVDPTAAPEAEPGTSHRPQAAPEPPAELPDHPGDLPHRPFAQPAQSQPTMTNPFIDPKRNNWVPAATGDALDLFLDREGSRRLPFSPWKGPPRPRR